MAAENVPEHVRGELLSGQGRAALAGGGLVEGDAGFDRVVAEPPAGAGREHCLADPGLR